ncbi:DMP19 family protein [Rhizobium sp. 21-4511-3d]
MMTRNNIRFLVFLVVVGVSVWHVNHSVTKHLAGILVSTDAIASTAAPRDIVDSNLDVVSDLLNKGLKEEEISPLALESYYGNFYLAEVDNGGFAQFVFNSGWDRNVVRYVRRGLLDIDARQNLALFDEVVEKVAALDPKKLETFLSVQTFGKDEIRDSLNGDDSKFFALQNAENLTKLNSTWLRRQPSLTALSPDALRSEIRNRVAAIPDKDVRAAAAWEGTPSYVKLIASLCAASGQKLDRITAGDPMLRYDGKKIVKLSDAELKQKGTKEHDIVWFFLTDKGLHMMGENNGRAAMFDSKSGAKVAEIAVP